jgi:hypothetical protein
MGVGIAVPLVMDGEAYPWKQKTPGSSPG